jgi:subtilisin family serine protease
VQGRRCANIGTVRRGAVAILLCAAPLLAAAPASASPAAERAAIKQALRASAQAAGAPRVVPLPLPEPAATGARAAALGRTEAALARDRRPGRLLVGVRTHADLPGVVRAVERLGAAAEGIDSMGVIAVRAPSVAAVASALRGDPRVDYVERDAVWKAADPFDGVDPATGISYNWAYDMVKAADAIVAAGGGSQREVAVIDTGADTGHPELAGRLANPFDTASGGSDVTDVSGHGTFASGLISGIDGNGIGARGVGGATTVFPVRASRDGSFTVSDILRALQFTITSRADIANLSLAGASLTRSQSRALATAFINDVLPVAASGNHGTRVLEFPAAGIGGRLGRRGIGLSVAAVGPDGAHASFSTFNDYVSVAAPGADQDGCSEGVFSTIPRSGAALWDDPRSCSRVFGDSTGRWAYAEGTSFAAPIAAAISALVWQVQPELASEQVADVVARSATQTIAGGRWNQFTGRGVVDGLAAANLARVYDIRAPRLRARARRRSGSTVGVRLRRSRDRTDPGRELARGVRYSVLKSGNGGRTYRFAVRPRRKAFRKTIRLRARRTLLVASVCDANGNCASKRLGRFRRR